MGPESVRKKRARRADERLTDAYGIEIRAVKPLELPSEKKRPRFSRYDGFDAGLHWSKVYKKGERFY